jgi:hypothetical protein
MEKEILKPNRDFLVTETPVDQNIATPNEIFEFLRKRKTTGQVIFHLSMGGIGKVMVFEKTRASKADRDRFRQSIGVGNANGT